MIFTSSNHDPFEIPKGNIEAITYSTEQQKTYDEKEQLRHKAIQYADNFAYMINNKVAILQPNKPIHYFDFDLETKALSPTKEDVGLGQKALAHALWGSIAYQNQWYRLSEGKTKSPYHYVMNK